MERTFHFAKLYSKSLGGRWLSSSHPEMQRRREQTSWPVEKINYKRIDHTETERHNFSNNVSLHFKPAITMHVQLQGTGLGLGLTL